MRAFKKFLRSDSGQALLSRLAARYLRVIAASVRWREERPAATEALQNDKAAFIGCFWHGRLAMSYRLLPKDQRFSMLISDHPDGRLIARSVTRLGADIIAGSPKRGGAGALREIQRRLLAKEAVGVTPDGPKGPRMRAKLGAVKAAQLSGAAILPVSLATSSGRRLGSWDRFWLPLPFGRGVILWGEPIWVERNADEAALENAREKLERALNQLSADADQAVGLSPLLPEGPSSGVQGGKGADGDALREGYAGS